MKNITIFGNATKDAELRQTQGGDQVCNFTIAVNDRREKEAYFFEVSYWGRAGSAVQPYIKKGNGVVVTGDFSWREYNGNKYLRINATSVSLAGGKGEDRRDNAGQQNKHQSQDRGYDFDDEIPF